MKTTRWIPLALAAVLALPTAVGAQSRSATIDLARRALEDSTAARLLMSVADPTSVGTDSLWAVSVHELALRLIESGDSAGAALWLRWATRHGGRWAIDRSAFPPRLIEAYDRAAAETRASAEMAGMESATETGWRWPSSLDRGAAGTIEIVSADAAVPISVVLQGRGSIESGGSIEVAPGTYELVASADGYDPVTVQREVLPGVATTVRFALPPGLPPSVEQRIASSLVSIRSMQAGQQVCTNGFVGPNGLILTSSSALPAAGGVEVATTTRVYTGVSVLARDADRDVAWLRFDDRAAGPLAAAGRPGAGPYAWSMYRDSCGSPTLARVRLASPRAGASFAPSFPGDARGAPLVDGTGALLGMVVAADRFLPIGLAEPVLDPPNPPQAASRRGFPIRWVSAGVAAAGLAAFLVGAGGSGGGPESPGSTTGDIVVTLPAG